MNDSSESYVPIEDLANYLSVKESTIRQWVKQGHIPKDTYIKVGYTYRYSIPQVVAALKQEVPEDNRPNPNDPVQLELDFNEEQDL
jgi:excisionase family DNA binding protein